MNKTRYTRCEIADMLSINIKDVHALCSPSKKSMIPDPVDSNIIDLAITKNSTYVNRKLARKEFNLELPSNYFGAKKVKERVVEKKEPVPPKPIKEAPKKIKVTAKKVKEPKKVVVAKQKPAPKEKPVPEPKIEVVKEVPTISKEEQERIEKEQSQARQARFEASMAMLEMDKAKLRKVQAEAERAEIILQKEKGDMISATSIIPFVKEMAKMKFENTLAKTMRLIKDMSIEYKLPNTYAGVFEREFTAILNESETKSSTYLTTKLNG